MLKKDERGDYIVSCDRCTFSDFIHFYDFRRAQKFYESQGWLLLDDGKVYCPRCRRTYDTEKAKS